MTPLKQLGEFFDGDLHIFNDASEGLSLEFSPGMHWDHDARSIPRTHVNSMAASLAAQFKTETLGDAGCFFARDNRQFRAQAEISMGLIRISSSGTGSPSSRRVST